MSSLPTKPTAPGLLESSRNPLAHRPARGLFRCPDCGTLLHRLQSQREFWCSACRRPWRTLAVRGLDLAQANAPAASGNRESRRTLAVHRSGVGADAPSVAPDNPFDLLLDLTARDTRLLARNLLLYAASRELGLWQLTGILGLDDSALYRLAACGTPTSLGEARALASRFGVPTDLLAEIAFDCWPSD